MISAGSDSKLSLLEVNSIKYLALSEKFLQHAGDVLQNWSYKDRTDFEAAYIDWKGSAWYILWTLTLSALLLFLLLAFMFVLQGTQRTGYRMGTVKSVEDV